mmetsp:Transcript_68354/g.137478  ORF Transcript_68354/g.137478 Transcript_68354/m.137478 type:complete len:297 (-) Transcript_68354:229-1119(-)
MKASFVQLVLWSSAAASPLSNELMAQFFEPGGVMQKDGFYLEMGAVDGIIGSHTLPFEDPFGWNGVLIEANPVSCAKLFKEPQRKTAMKFCASCCEDPGGFLDFEITNDPSVGAAMNAMDKEWRKTWHTERDGNPDRSERHAVPCAPLGRMLRQVGVEKIDLFSLDVEEAEVLVLNTFDWRIPVRVFVIEVATKNEQAIKELLEGHGYMLTEFSTATVEVHRNDQLWVHSRWESDWDRGAAWKPWKPARTEKAQVLLPADHSVLSSVLLMVAGAAAVQFAKLVIRNVGFAKEAGKA